MGKASQYEGRPFSTENGGYPAGKIPDIPSNVRVPVLLLRPMAMEGHSCPGSRSAGGGVALQMLLENIELQGLLHAGGQIIGGDPGN